MTSTTACYNARVNHGWTLTVTRPDPDSEQVAPGFELLAQAVVSTLQQLSVAGLEEEDQQVAEDAANEVLAQVTQPVPDRGKVTRALGVEGALALVALGLRASAGDGTREWAKTAVEQLGTPF